MAQPLLSPSTGAQIANNALAKKAPKSQKVNKPNAELVSQYPLEACGSLIISAQHLTTSLVSFNRPPISLTTALGSLKT
jgi:hypothetical protein